ncbi:hypothetical protein SCHPADRAFT_910892 [Schizopora paradoxa]|uniref:Uncharacterized protein n=1 Tax=Schizopora paradoxa TaxID=27342 RepID=A0A0H2R806_9AGAM|nr:hypothetical protein SCHPADRAFT_910892 [Schizopora paradoxa]
MSTPNEFLASVFPAVAFTPYAGSNSYPPVYPALRAPADALAYSVVSSESVFKFEEARFEALKNIFLGNQELKEERLKAVRDLDASLLTRLEAEIALANCLREKAEKEKVKLDLEIQLLQKQVGVADISSEAPTQQQPSAGVVQQMLTELEEMKPCPSGHPWEDRPDLGGFNCKGGHHFMSYDEAKAMVAQ